MVLPSFGAPFLASATSPPSSVRWPPRLALVGPTAGLSQGKPRRSPNQATDVSRMVAHPELLPPDHLRHHPLARPRLSSKAVRLGGSSRRKLGRFGALWLAQAGRRPGRRLVPHKPSTPSSSLARFTSTGFYGPFRDPQGVGYLRSFPSPAPSTRRRASRWPGSIMSSP